MTEKPPAGGITRSPRVGDRIRIVRLPAVWSSPTYHLPAETRRLFKLLILRGRALRVQKIDEQGLPWIHCQVRQRNGVWHYHSLAVDNDSWVKVKRRRK